jgi:DNA polymerase (family 10)
VSAPAISNAEIAAVFAEMADLAQIAGGDEHRVRAFRRAARVLASLPHDAATLVRQNALDKVPGLGEGSVFRVKQILRTGTTDEHARLRAQLPPGLREMLEVNGLGASTVRRLWQHLKVASLEQLEWACRTGAVAKLPRMGDRTAERILKGIADHRIRVGRLPYASSRRMGERLAARMGDVAAVGRVMLTGSVRRGRDTIGDLDLLVASDDGLAVTSAFVTFPEVDQILVRGEGRASVRLRNGQQCDVRVVEPDCWGAGLHYFTGSQLHNIAVRSRALKVAGLKISDKGIFLRDTDHRLAPGHTEEEIFAAAKLPFIAPELRENTGEIEAAAEGRLPRLVTEADLRGDLHCHTRASDGSGSALDMALAAGALGLEYLAITDHSQSLTVARGLDERRLLAQQRHIRELEQQVGRLRLLAGVEVDILPDGRLDLDHAVLRGLDWVVASIHLGLEQSGAEQTERLLAAIRTGLVDCIGHPTGRRIGERSGAELDLERILVEAGRYGVIVELNGNPSRMDLPDVDARRAKELGVAVGLHTDAHAPEHLGRREFGLVTARRAWLEPRDISSCWPWAALADRRRDRLAQGGVAVHGWSPAPAHEIEPMAPAVAGHWPEPDSSPAVLIAAPEPEPDLAPRLRAPLDDALRERVESWLRAGGDPELEAALATLGPPMQAAFALLVG